MQSLRHLVVGTDFSRCAESALDCAVTLANLALARITVVHVCELSTELGLPDDLATPAFDEERLASCGDKLAALVARYARCGVEVKGLLRSGKPWEKLTNAATEVGASMMVVGRVGSSSDQHGTHRGAPLGRVAEHLLRCATRPVVTVPLGEPALSRSVEP